MALNIDSKWLTFAIAAVSAYAALSFCCLWKRESKELKSKIRELEKSAECALEKCAAERQGRIRAQQALRKALTETKSDDEDKTFTSYPMKPIGTVRSCFSTRNGTPRQPLVVPLARACLVFDPSRVPSASLEGFEEYSHCWIIYVFHLNTDLEKLWMKTSQSKFKAKVRVPRLKGGRMGVFATRSPHRPCPIGLTVAKVEAVKGNMILLSGVDLVDGTPVLDIKPYLPYCDGIQSATVPKWVMEDDLLRVNDVRFSDGFCLNLAESWLKMEESSLYGSSDEIKRLIKQVLSWDIRSVAQRNKPHDSNSTSENDRVLTVDNEANGNGKVSTADTVDVGYSEANRIDCGRSPLQSENVIYHLILEGLDISYTIDSNGKVIVENTTISSSIQRTKQNCCNYSIWKDIIKT